MDPRMAYSQATGDDVAYTNCKTRIITLQQLDLPESGTEEDYQRIFAEYSQTNTQHAQSLTDAINSVRYGIAPPVAFPTETVYGLGADATNRTSIAGIFAAKGRPSDNPLIVHVASKFHLEKLTGEQLPKVYDTLVEEFWPGPLTILVPVPDNSPFAENVHPGQKTIGFRVPQSKYARFFIAATDRPIAGPSANSSGKPSPTTAQHVMDDLAGSINFILDGGSCDVGVESTVVDGLCDPPLILRPGGVSQEELIAHGKKHENVWMSVGIGYKQTRQSPADRSTETDVEVTQAPRAPGMKYKHYAPTGKMVLFEDVQSYGRLHSEINHLIDETLITATPQLNAAIHSKASDDVSETPNLTIAILTSTTWSAFADLPLDTAASKTITASTSTPSIAPATPAPETDLQIKTARYRQTTTIHSIPLGRHPQQIAHTLFAALRKCDDLGCQYIFAEAPTAAVAQSSLSSLLPVIQLPLETKHHLHSGGQEDKNTNQNTNRTQNRNHYDAVIERMKKAASQIL